MRTGRLDRLRRKTDVDNFYHRLRLPVWLRPYFALPPLPAGRVSSSVAASFGADTLVFPMCTTLPMGWSHSVVLAQEAHRFVLESRTSLSAADRIDSELRDVAVRPDRVLHALYIDDLTLIGRDRDRLAAVHAECEQAMISAGLQPKASKRVLPTSGPVDVLGVQVDGRRLTVGLAAGKLLDLVRDTSKLLREQSCTGLGLAKIVGRWVWAMLATRPALSVFNAVFRFVECARRRTFTIWQSVRKELRVAMGLAPLLVSSIGDKYFDRVLAVDASSSGFGVVAARVPAGVSVVSDDSADSTGRSVNVSDVAWRTAIARPWRRPEHINVLEARALYAAVRWALSFPSAPGCRLCVLCDSQVVVHSARKGRSSSPPLLARLRCIAARLLMVGVKLEIEWLPSELNPADAPSRLFQYRC